MKEALQIFQNELESIRTAGTFKEERIITTPQKARIDMTKAQTTTSASPTTRP